MPAPKFSANLFSSTAKISSRREIKYRYCALTGKVRTSGFRVKPNSYIATIDYYVMIRSSFILIEMIISVLPEISGRIFLNQIEFIAQKFLAAILNMIPQKNEPFVQIFPRKL